MPSPFVGPSLEDVKAIIALNDKPIVRNLQITQCYHDLSRAMVTLVGPENANWCTFATWASKTAGRFIRYEEFRALFHDAIAQSPRYTRGMAILNTRLLALGLDVEDLITVLFGIIDEVLDDVSSQVATGNLKVFKDLGRLFASMMATFADDLHYDATKLNDYIAQLKPGATASGGQELLRDAVTHYYQAKFEPDANRKAELLLYANAQAALHEQIRLQPYIAGAINAPIADTLQARVHEAYSRKLPGGSALRQLLHVRLDMFLRPIVDEVEKVWQELATHFLMQLHLPDGTIHLGEDLQALPGQPLFPPALLHITNTDLQALLALYGADGDTSRGSGAHSWADLSQRMRFILELFRSRQQDASLFNEPFTAPQRQDIAAGDMPGGDL